MFKVGIEEPIVPVKIQFPQVLVTFFKENFLGSIARNIGRVLKLDLATLHVTFAMAAIVTMEVEL